MAKIKDPPNLDELAERLDIRFTSEEQKAAYERRKETGETVKDLINADYERRGKTGESRKKEITLEFKAREKAYRIRNWWLVVLIGIVIILVIVHLATVFLSGLGFLKFVDDLWLPRVFYIENSVLIVIMITAVGVILRQATKPAEPYTPEKEGRKEFD